MKPKFATVPLKGEHAITVIIPAYNEEEAIRETITSVQNQSVPIADIIVVDDHSSDKTSEIALSMGVTVVRTDVNQGTKAKAQQYVIERGHVKTDLFVTIDGDTILDKYAIEKTLPYFNDPKCASVCGFVIPNRIRTIWEKGRFIEYIFGISIFKAAQNNIGAVMVSSGCFSIFRTKLVEIMGGFKARSMAEDMDLTWEFNLAGYNIYCEPNALCYPNDPPTLKIFVAQIDRWYRSFFQNISIHKGKLMRKPLLTIFIFGYLVESILAPFIMFAALVYSTQDPLLAFLLTILIDFLIVSVSSLPKGIRLGMFRQTLISLLAYPIIRPVNFYVFWVSLWKEWIMRDTLRTWNKGH